MSFFPQSSRIARDDVGYEPSECPTAIIHARTTPDIHSYQTMIAGLQYLVVQSSADETFQKGDHIRLEANGDLVCREGGGWISADQVEYAALGMRVQLDQAYALDQIAKHQESIRILCEQYDLRP